MQRFVIRPSPPPHNQAASTTQSLLPCLTAQGWSSDPKNSCYPSKDSASPNSKHDHRAFPQSQNKVLFSQLTGGWVVPGPLSPPSGCAIPRKQKVIPKVCHQTWSQCSLQGRSRQGVLVDCHPPAFMSSLPSQPLCPGVVSPTKDVALLVCHSWYQQPLQCKRLMH